MILAPNLLLIHARSVNSGQKRQASIYVGSCVRYIRSEFSNALPDRRTSHLHTWWPGGILEFSIALGLVEHACPHMACSEVHTGIALLVFSIVFGTFMIYLLLAPVVLSPDSPLVFPYDDQGVSTPLAVVLSIPTILVAGYLNWFFWKLFVHN